jgi:threonine synthase
MLVIAGEIAENDLRRIVEESITFPAPLRTLDDETAVLELFHGPTLAFKDFGARFMARTLAYLHRGDSRAITILVATSGDTGSAVASGFHNVEGMDVVLLYPSGRVSTIQELQLTALTGNVVALEIDGTFDDCQRLVKLAFADRDITSHRALTSANSINVARLFPQTFYYFNAFARLPTRDHPLVFSVPCGNLGNLTAGLMAWKMGLPVRKFIAATNANDVLTRYLATGQFTPSAPRPTLSNAMDVGNPSNFARIAALFGDSIDLFRTILVSASYTDAQTRAAIEEALERYGYLLDPHGAVAFAALRDLRAQTGEGCYGVFLETAHPAKFPEVYAGLQGARLETPERLQRLLQGGKHSVKLPAQFDAVKEYLLTS